MAFFPKCKITYRHRFRKIFQAEFSPEQAVWKIFSSLAVRVHRVVSFANIGKIELISFGFKLLTDGIFISFECNEDNQNTKDLKKK